VRVHLEHVRANVELLAPQAATVALLTRAAT
jgi:hypothetical protein